MSKLYINEGIKRYADNSESESPRGQHEYISSCIQL